MKKMPDLSVIIPTYKRDESLERLLERLQSQENIILEVIVVDQNKPGFFNEALNKRLEQVIHIRQESPNTSLARNTGFKISKASHILFLDDDLMPEPEFCRKALDVFKKYPSIQSFIPLVYSYEGKEIALSDAKRKMIKSVTPDKSIFTITDAMSAAVFFERSYFKMSGGFDTYLFEFAQSAEDIEFFLRMRMRNMRLWFIPFVEIFHDEKVAGGCELRTAGYWVSRRKNIRGMAYRLRSHNHSAGNLSFKNFVQILRSFVINKAVLKSGLKNIKTELKLLFRSVKESQKFYVDHQHKYSSFNFIED
jgi:Predicted glycosyltransferases